MRDQKLVAMAAMAGASLCAGQSAAGQQATVAVCIESGPHFVGVQPLASQIFASIGVRIDWRGGNSCPVGVGAIQVHLSYDPPSIRRSYPFGFAQTEDGTVVVFPDRVQSLNRNGGPSLMAHVLVHEITHVLEGISRHSVTGIMKPRWDANDFSEMDYKPLPFAQEDIDLIYVGLKARQARVVTAVPAR